MEFGRGTILSGKRVPGVGFHRVKGWGWEIDGSLFSRVDDAGKRVILEAFFGS